jgi:hemoglobin-like flavoprotein
MDATTILLQRSWQRVCENLPGFSNLFYGELFSTNPSLRELFRYIDADAQDKHLHAMLSAFANGQINTRRLIVLGRRYAGHGIRSAHYDVIVRTLLWTFEQQLGSSWTLAARNAWDDTLTRAAAAMIASDRRSRCGTLPGNNLIPFPLNRAREARLPR